MYQLTDAGVINDTGASVPHALGNKDWQAFLEFAADLGIPLDAQGVPVPDGINILAVVVPDPMDAVVATRDAKLVETDWTQLQNTSLTVPKVNAFATYRQALRDVPQVQPTATIDTVVWPTAPANRRRSGRNRG